MSTIVETRISSRSIYGLVDLKELWRYRELCYIFIWRDIKVKYKQTILGILWVVFQPLFTTGIFTFFFQKILTLPDTGFPYPLSVLCGLVCWNYFSTAVTASSESILANEGMIKKVYFPRILLPATAVIAGLVDFFITSTVLFVIATVAGYPPKIGAIIALPAAILLLFTAALGSGLFLSALNLRYRDVRYILPFFIQLLLFLSPVIYPSSVVSPVNATILALNPATSAIELIRWIFIPERTIAWDLIGISALSCIICVCIGGWYLMKTEQFISDTI